MRIYKNFREALSEITRDLAEMGIRVHPATYQDKNVKDDPDFETLEIQNYVYTVTQPRVEDLNPIQPWAEAEWGERLQGIHGQPVNPGVAWTTREDVWREFLQEDGKFAYTYSERLCRNQQVLKVINRLKVDPDSRQLFISIWDVSDVDKLGGISRVPCSLGYLIQYRGGGVNLTYLQRSADIYTHFVNDIYLAFRLQKFIAREAGYPVGRFTHWIGSLHVFRKHVKEVF